jgi:5-hydroxyisourate hydrolase-like protein (transthyretin family)
VPTPEPPASGLACLVIDATTGEPIVGAEVDVVDQDGNILTTLTSDENGLCALTDIPDGAYALVASAPGYNASDPLVGLVEGASALVLPLQPIPPPPVQLPGVSEEPMTPESPPSADSPQPVLTCVVTDAATAQPVAAASVDVLDTDGNVVETVTADDTGACSSSDLPAGDFALVASAPGYMPSDPQPVAAPSIDPVSLQLVPDDSGQVAAVPHVRQGQSVAADASVPALSR